MLAMVPRGGQIYRKKEYDNNGDLKSASLSKLHLMLDEKRLDEFKKMLGKNGKAKVHVYFVHGLLTSFREFEAVNYMEYNLLADEVLNLKGI